jgi:hypothetical protein
MFIDVVKARRGIEVPVGAMVYSAEFEFVVAGVDGEWGEAQKRATGLAEQAVDDFLDALELDETPESKLGEPAKQRESRAPQRQTAVDRRMYELIFDATNSKQRSDRILRATSEEMSLEPDPYRNGWICTDKNGRQFRVDADKARGVGRCTCEDFLHRGISSKMPCKHIYALVISSEQFWNGQEHKST